MPATQEGLARAIERTGLMDHRIVDALREVAREDFVPESLREEAYRDQPIPIPEGQTTSQPSLIAHMIDALAPKRSDKVLEVGSGFGFQTALLARLADRVISVDRWPALVEATQRNVERNGVANVSVYLGDGWKGWPERAPFDAIVVSAVADEVPGALVDQLAEGGRLVIPVKRKRSDEVVLYRKEMGKLQMERVVTPARFVPLVREEG